MNFSLVMCVTKFKPICMKWNRNLMCSDCFRHILTRLEMNNALSLCPKVAEKVSWNVPNYVGFLKRLLLFPSNVSLKLANKWVCLLTHVCASADLWKVLLLFTKKEAGIFFFSVTENFCNFCKKQKCIKPFSLTWYDKRTVLSKQ